MSQNRNLPVAYRKESFEVAPRQPQAVIAVAAAIGVTLTVEAATAILVSIALSMALSLVQMGIGLLMAPKRPRPERVKVELQQDTSLPVKRFAYGEFFAPATPAPRRVKGDILYGCYILNSRASDGSNLQMKIDGKLVALTGDAFDFAGTGAEPSDTPYAGYVRVWIGLGDQSGPPDDVLSEAGSIFEATDAWAGCTVAWVACDIGPIASQRDRWPSGAPRFEFSMRWSKVWDFTDGAQSLDDDTTWAWSANHALCLLDAHTQNPIQPYAEGDLDVSGGWTDAKTAADQVVTLPDASTEKRYEVHGMLIFDESEMATLFEPMFAAGAARPVVIGGRSGIVPGVYQSPSVTVADVVGDGLQYDTLSPDRDVANTIRCTYRAEDRGEESAELEPYSVAGAVADDGGTPRVQRLDLAQFVKSPYQAARCQVIAAYEARAQKVISGIDLPPEYFNLVAGAASTVAFPAPYDAMDGTWQIEQITPRLIDTDVDGNGGVAMRLSATLREYSAARFTAADAYEPVIPAAEPLPVANQTLDAPTDLAVSTAAVTSGATTVTGAKLQWTAVDREVMGYQVQYRVTGEDWQDGPPVTPDVRDAGGAVFVTLSPLKVGEDYDYRVRAALNGKVSAWTELLAQTLAAPVGPSTSPSGTTATAISSSEIEITATVPNDLAAVAIVFYGGDSNDTGTMSSISNAIYAAPNLTISFSETGLSSAQTRYYATRTLDQYGSLSAFSSIASATTP